MPRQSGSGIRGTPWAYCDRCGLQYPIDQLLKQRGLLVCGPRSKGGCFDNPLIFEREEIIQDVLSYSGEELDTPDILKRDTGDPREF